VASVQPAAPSSGSSNRTRGGAPTCSVLSSRLTVALTLAWPAATLSTAKHCAAACCAPLLASASAHGTMQGMALHNFDGFHIRAVKEARRAAGPGIPTCACRCQLGQQVLGRRAGRAAAYQRLEEGLQRLQGRACPGRAVVYHVSQQQEVLPRGGEHDISAAYLLQVSPFCPKTTTTKKVSAAGRPTAPHPAAAAT
jgi:hypothetical protein